jgi:hypothetical protein
MNFNISNNEFHILRIPSLDKLIKALTLFMIDAENIAYEIQEKRNSNCYTKNLKSNSELKELKDLNVLLESFIKCRVITDINYHSQQLKEISNKIEKIIDEHEKRNKVELEQENIKKMKIESSGCCLDVNCSERIPRNKWKCPKCDRISRFEEDFDQSLDEGRMQCLWVGCGCLFHWCAYIGDYDCENSPYHKNII